MLNSRVRSVFSATARQAEKNCALCRGFLSDEADDGIRTHDLLHGKRVVGSGPSARESRTVEAEPDALSSA